MCKQKRQNLAEALEETYADLHQAGYALLEGARYTQNIMYEHYLRKPSFAARCALAGATLYQATVHTGLFLVWAPTNAARITATMLLTPGAASTR